MIEARLLMAVEMGTIAQDANEILYAACYFSVVLFQSRHQERSRKFNNYESFAWDSKSEVFYTSNFKGELLGISTSGDGVTTSIGVRTVDVGRLLKDGSLIFEIPYYKESGPKAWTFEKSARSYQICKKKKE